MRSTSLVCTFLSLAGATLAQGGVEPATKIDDFDLAPHTLPVGAAFGTSVAWLGDLDGDPTTEELAVGANFTNQFAGEVWILCIDRNTKAVVKVLGRFDSSSFTGSCNTLDAGDEFGTSVAAVPDLNGDGVVDLLVGAPVDDDTMDIACGGAPNPQACGKGAVWVLYLSPSGGLVGHGKLSDLTPQFTGMLSKSDRFGHSVEVLGDLDGDGLVEVAVGASQGGGTFGEVWILSLGGPTCPTSPDCPCTSSVSVLVHGSIQAPQAICPFKPYDFFGADVALLGDLDSNGSQEIAISSTRYDQSTGGIWIYSLAVAGPAAIAIPTVPMAEIGSKSGGLPAGMIKIQDAIGHSLAGLGDASGDGVPDLAVGMPNANDSSGAVWLFSLTPTGGVRCFRRLDSCSSLPPSSVCPPPNPSPGLLQLHPFDQLGIGLDATDLDGDGRVDLAIGAPGDDAGCGCDPVTGAQLNCKKGAVWLTEPKVPNDLCGFPDCLSLQAGGTQIIQLSATAANAGQVYFLLGSLSGTSPGCPLGGLTLPLNCDAYFYLSLLSPHQAPVQPSIQFLDPDGRALAALNLPPGTSPGLAGTVANHAYFLLGTDYVSEPVAVRLIP